MKKDVFIKLQQRQRVIQTILDHINDPGISMILSDILSNMRAEIEDALAPPGGWVNAYKRLVALMEDKPQKTTPEMDLIDAYEALLDYTNRLYLANDFLSSKVDNETNTEAMAILMDCTLEEQKAQDEKFKAMISKLLEVHKSV